MCLGVVEKFKGQAFYGVGFQIRSPLLIRRSAEVSLRVYRPEGRRQSFQRGLFESMKNSGSTEKSRSSGYLEATFRKNKYIVFDRFPKIICSISWNFPMMLRTGNYTSEAPAPWYSVFGLNILSQTAGLEKSAAIRPFATKKSRLASEKILLADSLATESCRLADRLATKLFFKADNADAD